MNPFIVLVALILSFTARATNLNLDLSKVTFNPNNEAVLRLSYELECIRGDSRRFRGVSGEIGLNQRTVRFELMEGTLVTRLQLGRVSDLPNNLSLTLNDSWSCKIKSLQYAFEEISNEIPLYRLLALRHSPLLNIRNDQYENRFTDRPLALGYSVKQSNDTFTIIYTAFFSDEDSIKVTDGMDAQMARYGRRTDIEWVYEVEFRKRTFTIVSRNYHSDFAYGIGHATSSFRGRFLKGTDHPLLYNIAKHNVFSDRPTGLQASEATAYHLIPLQEIPKQQARENLMFDHPWLFSQSDQESGRENKLSQGFENHLFVRMHGKLSSGAFVAVVTLEDGTVFKSGMGKGNVDRLGEDLWGKESYTAIPLGTDRLKEFESELHGTISFERVKGTVDLTLEEIGFLIPVQMNGKTAFKDVSATVNCSLKGLDSICKF